MTQRETSASGDAVRFAGVSITLGSTQLTVTPWSRSSTASAFVSAITVALETL